MVVAKWGLLTWLRLITEKADSVRRARRSWTGAQWQPILGPFEALPFAFFLCSFDDNGDGRVIVGSSDNLYNATWSDNQGMFLTS
jgi:hypothetical protein